MAKLQRGGYAAGRVMSTILLAFVGTMLLLAWGFTIAQWKQASEGYEDEQGFHFGPDPRLEGDAEFVLRPVPVETDLAARPRD